MSIGQRMRDKRIELNIQPKEIADKIGKSLSTYYRYETGEIEKLTISKMCEIAEILNVSPDYLLLGLTSEKETKSSKKDNINCYNIMSFSAKLKDLMVANRISYEELANDLSQEYKINITAGDIANWEKGNQSPDVASFVALSEYFKVSIDFLIGKSLEALAVNGYAPKAKEPNLEYNKESFVVKNLSKVLKNSKKSLEEISDKTGIEIDTLKKYAEKLIDEVDQKHLLLIGKLFGISYVDMNFERIPGPIIEKIAALDSVQLDQVEEFIDKLLVK